MESRKSPWLYSPGVDLSLLVMVTLSALIPWVLATRYGWTWRSIVILVGVFNGAHQISTWTRVYFRSDERTRRPVHYWVVPAVLIAFVATCEKWDDVWGPMILRTVLFYWASWHFVAQCWGILKMYHRRHGAMGTPLANLEKALVFLPAFFFVLRRLKTGPWTLLGSYILHPPIPAWLVNGLGAVIVVLAGVYLYRLFTTDERVHFVRPLFLASSAFGFFVPYMLLNEGSTAFAAAAFWHAIQYVAIVWLFNRKYFTSSEPIARKDWMDRTLVYLCQPGRTWLYFASMIVPGTIAYVLVKGVMPLYHFSLEQAVTTVWSAGTLAHYYLDGVIWKFKRYAPQLQPLATAA
jgi:hypothetical protein